MKTRMSVFIFLAALLAAPAGSAAQDNPPGPGPFRPNVRENLITLRILRMTAALDLTEDQTTKIYPLINRVEKDKLKVQTLMSVDLRSLRGLVHDPAAKEADILARVRSVQEARQKIRAFDDEVEAILEKCLTPAQKGKYVLFQVDFYRGLGDTIDQLRQRRGQAGPLLIKK
jgi:Spy/CpxP family protein refolding chaperone